MQAYGAAVYIRTKDSDGNFIILLSCAKSRGAPLKTVTLPKLELSAAQLLARLMAKLISEIKFSYDKLYYWTDSSIVLSWIQVPSNT